MTPFNHVIGENPDPISGTTLVLSMVVTIFYLIIDAAENNRFTTDLIKNKTVTDIIVGIYGFLYGFGGFRMMVSNPIYSIIFGSTSCLVYLILVREFIRFVPKLQLPICVIFIYAGIYRFVLAWVEPIEYVTINSILIYFTNYIL